MNRKKKKNKSCLAFIFPSFRCKIELKETKEMEKVPKKESLDMFNILQNIIKVW